MDALATRLWAVVLGALLLGGLWVASPFPGVASAANPDVSLEVSFEPGASVRLRGEEFVTPGRTGRTAVNDVIGRHAVARIERVFQASEASLDAARERLRGKGERDVPDLNRHYRIVAESADERDRLISALGTLSAVDEVIPAPRPVPPPAPDFTAQQRYRLPAPVGLDTAGVAGLDGGTGDRVKIIDIEYSWNAAHEDLAKAATGLIPNGTPRDPFTSTNHGTAVLGELIATANAFGVSGLASGGAIGMVNAANSGGYQLPQAVNLARGNLSPGDVMLVEQQFPVTPNGFDYVPSEYWPAVYDAIKLATQSGIIVVEAAGNGGVNLDGLTQPFPSGKPDSGAIIVGAGSGDCTSPTNARLSFSTYGARVNVQGWGQCVTTTGYGDLFNGGPNAQYTAGFGGTSSAAPIVASAAALYSSVFKAAAGGRAPSPLAVRNRLMATGTPQAATGGHIGPLPNATAATTNFDFMPPTVSFSGSPTEATNDTTPTFAFTASEPGSTLECRVVGVTSFSACTSPHTTVALDDGAAVFEVRATDAALNPGVTSRAFTIDTIAPTVSVTDGPSGLTSEATPTFAFAASEPGSTFECRVAGVTSFSACTSPYTAAALGDGAAVFEVKATDAALNPGAASRRAFTVEAPAAAPSVTLTSELAAPGPGSTVACGVAGVASFAGCAPPAPTTAPPTIAASTRLTVRVPRSGSVRLPRPRVSCPSQTPACSVSATARLATGRRSRIGRFSSTLAPGTSTTIRFRLTRESRALLTQRGRLRATVAISARHGSVMRARTVQLTLRRRR